MRFFYAVACATWLACSTTSYSAEIFVKSNNSESRVDPGLGTPESPFAGLEAARERVRDLKARDELDSTTTIWLAAGNYHLDDTLVFGADDSGDANHTIIWRAVDGGEVSFTSNAETILAIYDAQDLAIRGITFLRAREQAVEIAHSFNVVLEDCRVLGSDHTGIHVFGGRDCSVRNCEVRDCLQTGVRIEAGDRQLLLAANHELADSTIQRCGEGSRLQAASVHVSGVGHTLRGNLISDSDASGIRIDGNDHLVTTNRLLRTCLNTKHNGAIYLGQDWTERGNKIVDNFIKQVGPELRLDLIGIYLDDLASGNIVEGNIVSDAGRGIAVAGGESNEISTNAIQDCIIGIQLDNRGQRWMQEGNDELIRGAIKELDAVWWRYATKYPSLPQNPAEVLLTSRDNILANNAMQRCGRIAFDESSSIALNSVYENELGEDLFSLDFDGDDVVIAWKAATQERIRHRLAWASESPIVSGRMITTGRN